MILAGGQGTRLGPLSVHRAKPAVPFGGRYRIVDFVLSNFFNSGYRQIYLLTQFMASSLIRHVSQNWQLTGFNEFLEVVPAQQRTGHSWYQGTADAIFQNLHLIERNPAEHFAVFGSDHIYVFAVNDMEAAHRAANADLTVAACPVPREEASAFGVIEVDAEGWVVGFEEKPADPKPIPGRPDTCLVSMGNYFFRTTTALEALRDDALDPSSSHDFGKDLIPRLVAGNARVLAYDFGENTVPGESEQRPSYWRDVGTIDAYFRANMDLRSPLPPLDLYNSHWPIRSAQRLFPPARFVQHRGYGDAVVRNSFVGGGTIVSSALLDHSVVGYDCFVHAGSVISNSILTASCDVGAGARLTRVLADKRCTIEPGTVIGEDPAADQRRFPWISPGGVVVLPQGTHVPREGPVEFSPTMAGLLEKAKLTRARMQDFAGRYTVRDALEQRLESIGPRYRSYGPSDD